MFSEEVAKPEGGGEGAKSVTIDEGESTTTQAKAKKSKDDQPLITNIESLYFANTHLFQGLSNELLLLQSNLSKWIPLGWISFVWSRLDTM